jgi:hypothetical protein
VTRSRRRGGILWDLFLIVLVVAAGATAWWQRNRLRGLLPASFQLGAPAPAAPQVAFEAPRSGAAFRSQVRELLGRHGVREAHLRRSYTVERRIAGRAWAEETLAIDRPSSFRGGAFLKELATTLTAHHLTLLRDESVRGEWTLELGEQDRVYLRLVLRETPATKR